MHREAAPAAGEELARLLPGLPDYCAAVLAEPDEDTRSRRTVGKRLALACSLLLAERERMAGRVAEVNRKFDDVVDQAREAIERERVARAKLRVASAGVEDVWKWAGDGEDHPESLSCPVVMSADTLRAFVAAERRVAELEEQAKAPPPAVAGLLAAVEAASSALAAMNNFPRGASADDARARAEYIMGEQRKIRAALDSMRAHLGGPPSPLARVAAVHVACFAEDEFADIEHFATVDEGRAFASGYASGAGQYGAGSCAAYVLPAQEYEMRAVEKEEQWKLALAAMLACDAAPVGGAKGGA